MLTNLRLLQSILTFLPSVNKNTEWCWENIILGRWNKLRRPVSNLLWKVRERKQQEERIEREREREREREIERRRMGDIMNYPNVIWGA